MPSETYRTLYRLIDTLPVVSSHEHHQTDDFQRQLTLDRMIEKSYVGWRGLLPGTDPTSRAVFLAQCRHSSYYVWLEKGIQRVHGFSEKITADNWDEISARISGTHAANPTAHIDILRNVGRYRRAVQDTYWAYGSDIGHPGDLLADHADRHVRALLPPRCVGSRRQQPLCALSRRAAGGFRRLPGFSAGVVHTLARRGRGGPEIRLSLRTIAGVRCGGPCSRGRGLRTTAGDRQCAGGFGLRGIHVQLVLRAGGQTRRAVPDPHRVGPVGRLAAAAF